MIADLPEGIQLHMLRNHYVARAWMEETDDVQDAQEEEEEEDEEEKIRHRDQRQKKFFDTINKSTKNFM